MTGRSAPHRWCRRFERIIEMGQHLIEVKAAIGHGNFLPWLEAEFGWSDRTAARLIRVAEKFDKLSNLDSVSPSALYILAAPSTPDDVRAGELHRPVRLR